MEKSAKTIVSTTVSMLFIIFVVKLIAMLCDIETIKVWFGLTNPNNQRFFQYWFLIGSLIWFVIGTFIWITDSKLFRGLSIIPLSIYGILQLLLFVIVAMSIEDYDQLGYLWPLFTALISFIPAIIIGVSED